MHSNYAGDMVVVEVDISSKQLIDYAVKSMKCKYLSVDKSNKLAKMIYDEYGFRVYQEDKKMYYMTLDKNPVKS